eukprot:6267923-Heterocapsa_arctica.AAC.1
MRFPRSMDLETEKNGFRTFATLKASPSSCRRWSRAPAVVALCRGLCAVRCVVLSPLVRMPDER